MAQGSGYLRGTIGCQGEENWQIDLDWYSIGHRITSEHLTAIIPWDENSHYLHLLHLVWVKIHEHTN